MRHLYSSVRFACWRLCGRSGRHCCVVPHPTNECRSLVRSAPCQVALDFTAVFGHTTDRHGNKHSPHRCASSRDVAWHLTRPSRRHLRRIWNHQLHDAHPRRSVIGQLTTPHAIRAGRRNSGYREQSGSGIVARPANFRIVVRTGRDHIDDVCCDGRPLCGPV